MFVFRHNVMKCVERQETDLLLNVDATHNRNACDDFVLYFNNLNIQV